MKINLTSSKEHFNFMLNDGTFMVTAHAPLRAETFQEMTTLIRNERQSLRAKLADNVATLKALPEINGMFNLTAGNIAVSHDPVNGWAACGITAGSKETLLNTLEQTLNDFDSETESLLQELNALKEQVDIICTPFKALIDAEVAEAKKNGDYF